MLRRHACPLHYLDVEVQGECLEPLSAPVQAHCSAGVALPIPVTLLDAPAVRDGPVIIDPIYQCVSFQALVQIDSAWLEVLQFRGRHVTPTQTIPTKLIHRTTMPH